MKHLAVSGKNLTFVNRNYKRLQDDRRKRNFKQEWRENGNGRHVRANVAILDGVRVESYGSKVPLNQVANVSVPDPRTIAIKPWDRKEIKNIEKAIMDSDVGITPENNGEVIRLNIPVPTEERRRDLVKQCNKIAEKAKVEVRNVRADIKDKLKKAIKDGLSEDNEKDAELELQKLHDKYIKKLDDLIAAKNKEIMTV